MWIVKADRPPTDDGAEPRWDFRKDFFPRRTRYKSEALALADEARGKGGVNVRVEREP